MAKKDKSTPWVILGREVGTATGWDQADTFVMQLYNFKPDVGWRGPLANDCVSFDFENGLVQTYDDNGQPTETADIVVAVADCPRRDPLP